MSRAQAQASTQGSKHSLMLRLRQAAYKIFRTLVAEEVLKLVDFGFTILPYETERKPAVTRWADLKDAEYSLQTVLELWERAKDTDYEHYGVMLGRPSGYLVLVDLDDVDATRAAEEGREEDRQRIVDDLAEKLEQILPKTSDGDGWGFSLPAVMLTRTRRGVHILIRLSSKDYEELARRLGKENAELGEAEYQNHKIKIELHVKGVTPLETRYHRTERWQLPLSPVSLRTLEKLLSDLGVRLPEPSKEERSSVAKTQNGNRHVQKTIVSDVETHTPVTNSIQDSSRETGGRRRLSETEVSKIVQVLAPFWIQYHRNNLELALIGWLWKAGVDYVSAERVIARIVEETGDEERDKRLAELRRQWKLFESGAKKEDEILGKTGIEKELEAVIAEKYPELSDEERRQKVFQVLYELEQILGRRRSKNIRAMIRPGVFVDNDTKAGIRIIHVSRDKDGKTRVSWETVLRWYIDTVRSVWGDTAILYSITFKHVKLNRVRTYTGTLAEIVSRILRELPGTGPVRREVLHAAISLLVDEFEWRGLVKRDVTAEAPGLMVADDRKLVFVREGLLAWIDVPEEPDLDKAREALRLLIRLREFYYPDKFYIVMQWVGYSVLAYPLNQVYNIRSIHLALLGQAGTGKSSLASAIISMLNSIDRNTGKSVGGNLGSYYRLAKALSTTMLPVLWDEAEKPGEALAQMIKRASTLSDTPIHERGDIGRQYFGRGTLIVTSNDLDILYQKALRDRFITLVFTVEDTPEARFGGKADEMRREYLKILFKFRRLAPHLGRVLIEAAIKAWERLTDNDDVYVAVTRDGVLEVGRRVWELVSEILGVEVPWAEKVEYREPDISADVKDIFYDWLGQRIRQVIVEVNKTERPVGDVWEILEELYNRKQLLHRLPWLHIDSRKMVITAGVLAELKKVFPIRHQYAIDSMTRLAEVLGLRYYNPKVKGKTVRGIVIPREVFERHVHTGEDYLIKYERELEHLIETGKLEADVQAVTNYLVYSKGLDRDTAEEIAREFAATHTYLFRLRARRAETTT